MKDADKKWTMRDRVIAVLEGRKPDRPPFIDRMEIWYKSKLEEKAFPDEFKGMGLREIHEAVGIGQLKFVAPYAHRLHGVEMVYTFENEVIHREFEPVMEFFPAQWAAPHVPRDKPGKTLVEFITPVGKLSLRYAFAENLIEMGVEEPYLSEHLIKEQMDYRIAEYIIERAEFIPQFDKIADAQKLLGDNGFAVANLHRVPFQAALLEYLGEVPLFTALYESRQHLERLLHILDQQLVDILNHLSDLPSIYVEFLDNVDGMMTNPNLFRDHSLKNYLRYTEILHGQGKKVGSHTDGNLKPLLGLLAESGLDVCESFSPAPLTECPFEEAWEAWKDGPIIWGGIPSPILEERTSESEFREYVHRLLETIGNQPIILGVGDMVLGNNLIERVQYIADEVEKHPMD